MAKKKSRAKTKPETPAQKPAQNEGVKVSASTAEPKASPEKLPKKGRINKTPQILTPILGLVTGMIAVTLIGFGLLSQFVPSYLNSLPANSLHRAEEMAAAGDVSGAQDLLLEEWDLIEYDFRAVLMAAELAAFHGDESQNFKARNALFEAFDRSLAIQGRDVFAKGWDEARALLFLGLCQAKIGELQNAALLAASAQELDRVRVPLLLREWALNNRELMMRVQRTPPPSVAAEPHAAGAISWWSADQLNSLEALSRLESSEVRGAQLADEATTGTHVVLYRNAFLVLEQPKEFTPPPGGTFEIVAGATEAYGSWPVVRLETASTGAGPWRALGAISIRWREPRTYRLFGLRSDDKFVRLIYTNDQYDAMLKKDRNLHLYSIGSGTGTSVAPVENPASKAIPAEAPANSAP